jgi:hypothetical protein
MLALSEGRMGKSDTPQAPVFRRPCVQKELSAGLAGAFVALLLASAADEAVCRMCAIGADSASQQRAEATTNA